MTEKAYLALGCFWGPDEHFSGLRGVVETQVGYSGGEEDNPVYEKLGGHAETIEVEFDPKKISFEEILEHFFAEHNPEIREISRYRSAIFYIGKDQRCEAEKAKAVFEKKIGRSVSTSIEPFGKFFRAEEYHQKYFEKMKGKR